MSVNIQLFDLLANKQSKTKQSKAKSKKLQYLLSKWDGVEGLFSTKLNDSSTSHNCVYAQKYFFSDHLWAP